MLVLSVKLTIHEGATAALLETVQTLVPLSRAEAGCHRYEFYMDPLQPDTGFFFELWDSPAALEAHMTSAHFKDFTTQLPQWCSEPPQIASYETLGPRQSA